MCHPALDAKLRERDAWKRAFELYGIGDFCPWDGFKWAMFMVSTRAFEAPGLVASCCPCSYPILPAAAAAAFLLPSVRRV